MLRRDFSNSLRATGLTKLNEDVVVPRSRLVELIEFAEALQERSGFPIACFGHAGDGNIHVNIMVADYQEPAVQKKVERALDELFQQVLAWGGVITGRARHRPGEETLVAAGDQRCRARGASRDQGCARSRGDSESGEVS